MESKTKKYIIISTIILILFFILINSIKIIPTGYVGIKIRFGKTQDDVITEGLNTKVPFIENIVKIDCRTKKIEKSSEGSTKDMQTAIVTIALNYNVIKDTSNILYKEVGKNYEDIIIIPSVLESTKSAMAQYTAEEFITKRTEVSNKIQETLIAKIEKRGFKVTDFNITNIEFSDEYNKAIEKKAVKQQEVFTAQAELEKQKIQNEKEISIAEKDAKVMELQNTQITDKTLQLKQLEIKEKMIEKWNGQFPSTILNDHIDGLFNLTK